MALYPEAEHQGAAKGEAMISRFQIGTLGVLMGLSGRRSPDPSGWTFSGKTTLGPR